MRKLGCQFSLHASSLRACTGRLVPETLPRLKRDLATNWSWPKLTADTRFLRASCLQEPAPRAIAVSQTMTQETLCSQTLMWTLVSLVSRPDFSDRTTLYRCQTPSLADFESLEPLPCLEARTRGLLFILFSAVRIGAPEPSLITPIEKVIGQGV